MSTAKSPAKISREQEKHELSDLNQRLGLYALNVRKVTENEQLLRDQLEDLRNSSAEELARCRELYDGELEDLRS